VHLGKHRASVMGGTSARSPCLCLCPTPDSRLSLSSEVRGDKTAARRLRTPVAAAAAAAAAAVAAAAAAAAAPPWPLALAHTSFRELELLSNKQASSERRVGDDSPF
jgi:hypothetical protein